ncbi:four helix bundle protein [Chloroflexi bacterium CFX6]|nr:four helix bundle protein [Chloroflexi bacterium CFX6]
MKIERFEDACAWQQARELANLVYDLTDQGNFAKDFRLRDQSLSTVFRKQIPAHAAVLGGGDAAGSVFL